MMVFDEEDHPVKARYSSEDIFYITPYRCSNFIEGQNVPFNPLYTIVKIYYIYEYGHIFQIKKKIERL
jgi:hypothetical protein